MSAGRRTGILKLLRGDGSLVRALLVALILQIAAPLLGLVPTASANLAPPGSITICTAQGLVTMVPDGQGGWTKHTDAAETGLSCSFCLPLLSGSIEPVADIALPLPVAVAAPPPVLAQASPLAATPPGSFSPRAPPVLR